MQRDLLVQVANVAVGVAAAEVFLRITR